MRGRITGLIGVAALLGLIFVAMPARAAGPRLLPEVGVNLPTGDMAENFSRGGLSAGSGLSAGASLERLIGPYFSVLADWRYFTFPIEDIGAGNVDLHGHAFGVTGRAYVEGRHARPFLTFGLMLAKPKLTGNVPTIPLVPGSRDATGTVSMDWTFGWHAGFGILDQQSEQLALFISLEYFALSTGGKTAKVDIEGENIPSTTEVKIVSDGSWFGIHGGVAFTVPGLN